MHAYIRNSTQPFFVVFRITFHVDDIDFLKYIVIDFASNFEFYGYL